MLAPGVDVLAVQYPGRQERRGEPVVESVTELADLVAEALRPWLDRPFALFGHSLGAVLAFEVARRLEREERVPLGLFASGHRAPHVARRGSVHLLDDDGLIAELRRLSGTDAALLADEELLRLVLPCVRADYKAAETYRYEPGPPLRCPIAGFTGDADPLVPVDELRPWSEHTSGGFELQVHPGGHFYLNDYVPALVTWIREFVSRSVPAAATTTHPPG
jgi:surfactin synthase thioesterase subunit